MSFLDFGDNPADWIVRGGKPAACMGPKGWPSYEDETGKFYVYEVLLVNTSTGSAVMALPKRYGDDALLYPGGLVPSSRSREPHWRPKVHIYAPLSQGGWCIVGSQQELAWRHGLHWAAREAMARDIRQMLQRVSDARPDQGIKIPDEPDLLSRIPEAEQKADRLLQECLTPFQLFEYRLTKHFRVIGGRTGSTYLVGLGDGFVSIDPLTGATIQSYCFHPDDWIPHEDVALATKLCLEDGELELDALERARPGEAQWPKPWMASMREQIAYEIEQGGM